MTVRELVLDYVAAVVAEQVVQRDRAEDTALTERALAGVRLAEERLASGMARMYRKHGQLSAQELDAHRPAWLPDDLRDPLDVSVAACLDEGP